MIKNMLNNHTPKVRNAALAACFLGLTSLVCSCQSVLKENAELLSGTWLELDANGQILERGLIFNLEGQAGTFNLEEDHFAPLTYDLSGSTLTVLGYAMDDGGVVDESKIIIKTCQVTTIDRENLSLKCSEWSKSYKRSIGSLLYDDSLLQIQAPEPDLRY